MSALQPRTMPQTQTQTRTTMKSGATGSCVTTFRKNGDIYAIAHTLKPTGAPLSLGWSIAVPAFLCVFVL